MAEEQTTEETYTVSIAKIKLVSHFMGQFDVFLGTILIRGSCNLISKEYFGMNLVKFSGGNRLTVGLVVRRV